MTIRKKIFFLAGILLALFGVVVGVLAVIQKLDSDQISNIAEYELPLTRLVAELDVDTDRYELGILRVLRLDPLNPSDLAAAISAKQMVTDELRADADAATALLAKAIQDTSYRTAERVELARIEGSFKYLSRSLDGFLDTGDLAMGALVDGRREDARTAALGFAKFAQAFGPDLSAIRRDLANLTDRATRAVLARQRLNTYLSFGLFGPPVVSALA
jgi:adenylate cyclase